LFFLSSYPILMTWTKTWEHMRLLGVFRKLGSSVIFALSNLSKLDNVDIIDDSVSKKPKKWISWIEWRDEIYKTRSTCIPYTPFVFIFDSLWIKHLFLFFYINVSASKLLLVSFLLYLFNVIKKRLLLYLFNVIKKSLSLCWKERG
jgi:hypothetical protein